MSKSEYLKTRKGTERQPSLIQEENVANKAQWDMEDELAKRLKEAFTADSRIAANSESSALTFGKVLLEVLNGTHGGYTKFLMEQLNIHRSAPAWDRCQYCLRVAKEKTGWKKLVVDPLAEKEKAVADLSSRIDLAKAAAEEKTSAMPIGAERTKAEQASKLRFARENKVLAIRRVAIESARERSTKKSEVQVVMEEVRESKTTLDGDITSITEKLRQAVNAAAKVFKKEQQLNFDFNGVGTEVKASVDELIRKTAQLAKRTSIYGMTFRKKMAEKARAASA